MMGLGGGLPKSLRTTLSLFLSFAAIIICITGQSIQPCASNALPPSTIPAEITYEFCQQVPLRGATPAASYNIWYKLSNSTSSNILTIVLSVPRNGDRWYGMGFNSEANRMSGTAAVIFWLNEDGLPKHGNYYLTASDISGVAVDNTKLTYPTGMAPEVSFDSNNLYLSLGVEVESAADFSVQNFVIGQPDDLPTGDVISGQQVHQGLSSVQIDFVSGTAVLRTVNVDSRRRTHGILNVLGWGLFLPIGAIVARYGRGFDPHWFYVHAVSQVVGYGLVMAGLITGAKLLDLLPGVDADNHKALGILLFILATLQISAVLIRPKKEAKLRRYWNWGHWWTGRVALVIGAINIFVGMHLADAGRKWKVGYGVVLGLELLVTVVLEIVLWANYARSNRESHLPQTALENGRTPNGASAAPPSYETNWDRKP